MIFRKKERDKNNFKQLQMTSKAPAIAEISVGLFTRPTRPTRPTHTPRVPSTTEGHAGRYPELEEGVSDRLK